MTIRAELSSDSIATSCGIEIKSPSPVLALCRELLARGSLSSASMAIYRDDTLCLKVRSIGEAAGLAVSPHGIGFKKRGRENEDEAPYSDFPRQPDLAASVTAQSSL